MNIKSAYFRIARLMSLGRQFMTKWIYYFVVVCRSCFYFTICPYLCTSVIGFRQRLNILYLKSMVLVVQYALIWNLWIFIFFLIHPSASLTHALLFPDLHLNFIILFNLLMVRFVPHYSCWKITVVRFLKRLACPHLIILYNKLMLLLAVTCL